MGKYTLQLGLKNDEVRLESYTPEWKDEFIKVKKELLKYTKLTDCRIEHIGSTAITGMSAKPLIDIVVGVDDLQEVDKPLLKSFSKAGFLWLRVERPGEMVLAKFSDDTYKEKTHFIHLVDYQKELWNNLIFFRDHLNSNEDERKQYLEIKLDYLKASSTGVNEYTDFKEGFVKEFFAKRTA